MNGPVAALDAGLALVVSAPSGGGKTVVLTNVMAADPEVVFSVSVTTREPRPGEIEGREYRFVDRPTFRKMIDSGELLEWAEVFDQLYGTPVAAVRDMLDEGQTVLLEIDVQGAQQVHEKMPDATCILIVPPDHPELTRRLRGRGSENEAELAKRLGKAAEEIAAAKQSGVYNHVVVNAALDEAVREIVEIVRSQRE